MKLSKLEPTVFFSGMAVMVIEIAGVRLLAPYLGDTLYSWTSSIAVVLAALGIGYYIGGKMADKTPKVSSIAMFLFIAGLFIGVMPSFSGYVLNFSLNFGFEYGPLFASVVLFAVPNVALGAITPYAVRLKTKRVNNVGESAGNLYAIATSGSIVGALLTGYVLVPYLGLTYSFLFTSAILILTGLIFFSKVFLLIIPAILLVQLVPVEQQNISGGTIVYQTDTQYYHLVISNNSGVLSLRTDLSDQDALYPANLLYPNSSGSFVPYTVYQRIVYKVNPNIKTALYLGLGDGSLVTDLYKHTTASIDVVEIDPAVVQAARQFFNFTNSTRISIHIEDARFFLRNTTKTYNLIVMDAYGGSLSMPYQLATIQTAEEIRDHLTPNGIFYFNILSPFTGNQSGVFKSLYKTYSTQFSNVYVFPMNTNLSSVQDIELIATNDNNYTQAVIVNAANQTIGNLQMSGIKNEILYHDNISTAGYPVLTDDKNPFDTYSAQVLTLWWRQLHATGE